MLAGTSAPTNNKNTATLKGFSMLSLTTKNRLVGYRVQFPYSGDATHTQSHADDCRSTISSVVVNSATNNSTNNRLESLVRYPVPGLFGRFGSTLHPVDLSDVSQSSTISLENLMQPKVQPKGNATQGRNLPATKLGSVNGPSHQYNEFTALLPRCTAAFMTGTIGAFNYLTHQTQDVTDNLLPNALTTHVAAERELLAGEGLGDKALGGKAPDGKTTANVATPSITTPNITTPNQADALDSEYQATINDNTQLKTAENAGASTSLVLPATPLRPPVSSNNTPDPTVSGTVASTPLSITTRDVVEAAQIFSSNALSLSECDEEDGESSSHQLILAGELDQLNQSCEAPLAAKRVPDQVIVSQVMTPSISSLSLPGDFELIELPDDEPATSQHLNTITPESSKFDYDQTMDEWQIVGY